MDALGALERLHSLLDTFPTEDAHHPAECKSSGTAQSTSVGNPTCSDLAVNLSVEDASTFLDAYRLGHLAVEVLVQTPPLHVQSGHSKVRHENPSCAVMGPS